METRFFLDTRAGKTGKGIPIKIAMTHRRKLAFINTNVKVDTVEQWDGNRSRVIKHPMEKILNCRLQTIKAQVDESLYRIEYLKLVNLDDITAVKAFIDEELDPTKKEKRMKREELKASKKLFLARFDIFVARHTESTQKIYSNTRSRLVQWLGPKLNKLSFEDINLAWLEDFDDFLKPYAPSVNGRGVHFRNIRAVFNDAIDHEITTNYPFRRFKIKSARTRKRSLNVEAIRELINADYLEDWAEKYRDFFMLSFCMTGMNVIDLCHLKELEDGRANFARAKTKRLYSIKVEPEAMEYINRLKGKDWLIYPMDLNKNYRSYYMRLCKGLKSVRDSVNERNEETGIKLPALTSYWARHSWATIAASIDIPKDTIAHALGHGNNTVTDIYIDFDQEKVDVANRKVLDYVFHGIDWRNPPVDKPKKARPKKK